MSNKTAFSLLMLAFLVACGEKEKPKPDALIQPAQLTQEEGLDLARKNNCLLCHAVDKKVVGPAWKDVSARYNSEIRAGKKTRDQVVEQLIEKVSRGGKGNWTDVTGGISMPANSPRVSKEDIDKLVHFVLSLK